MFSHWCCHWCGAGGGGVLMPLSSAMDDGEAVVARGQQQDGV